MLLLTLVPSACLALSPVSGGLASHTFMPEILTLLGLEVPCSGWPGLVLEPDWDPGL